MDRYYTVMIVPEKKKGIRSFRLPRIVFRGIIFLLAAAVMLVSVFLYDYWKVMRQVYQNQHLSVENRQLKEQIQLFQMKINSLGEDIQRIQTFEQKLRVMTGLEKPTNKPISETKKDQVNSSVKEKFKDFKTADEFIKIENLYKKKISSSFSIDKKNVHADAWFSLTNNSLSMAGKYAEFDYKFNIAKDSANALETKVNTIDQSMLDRDSFLASTPTLLPTRGWITSYYGMRSSPTSKGIRMHEGLDIGGTPGTPIVAPADAKVRFAGVKPGFGNFVHLNHGYGIETFYAHSRDLFVKQGQVVTRGQRIASLGNTGSSTGPHLHYEVRVNGTPVDPLHYILDLER